MKNLQSNKAIFLDRDGTLNFDSNYVYKIEDLIILPGVKAWLEILKGLWYLLIIISNQSGIAKWYYTLEDTEKFSKELEKRLWITFDEIYICPHNKEDNCNCRKPKIEHISKAKEKYNLDLSQCYFIGDKDSDIECGKNAWCKTVYVPNEIHKYKSDVKPDYTVVGVEEFANILKA